METCDRLDALKEYFRVYRLKVIGEIEVLKPDTFRATIEFFYVNGCETHDYVVFSAKEVDDMYIDYTDDLLETKLYDDGVPEQWIPYIDRNRWLNENFNDGPREMLVDYGYEVVEETKEYTICTQ